MTGDVTPQKKFCSSCNEVLVCGATEAAKSCWCTGYPNIMPIDAGSDCLCEACLRNAIQKKLNKPTP